MPAFFHIHYNSFTAHYYGTLHNNE